VATTKDGIRVVIYDQEYHIKGQLDAEYIEKLARYLDAKMRSIAGRTRTVDSLRVAVLAGLNIADEYHQLKARHDAATSEVNQKVGEYNDALDQILKHAL
jgi:cell division protein ZapA